MPTKKKTACSGQCAQHGMGWIAPTHDHADLLRRIQVLEERLSRLYNTQDLLERELVELESRVMILSDEGDRPWYFKKLW